MGGSGKGRDFVSLCMFYIPYEKRRFGNPLTTTKTKLQECEAKSLQRVSFCLVQHLISLPFEDEYHCHFPVADSPDRNIHVGEGGGVCVCVCVCVSLDLLLKQPRSHFVQKESRTCQGC